MPFSSVRSRKGNSIKLSAFQIHMKDLFRSKLCTVAASFIGLGISSGQAQPANNMFANRTVITGTNIAATGSNVGANKEAGEPYHAGASGGASVWWSWKAPTNGTATLSTAGSSFDTLLGVYTGTSVSALTEAASNDDEDYNAGIYTSKVVFDATSNQVYQIAVDGYSGASGSVKLSVVLGPLAPPPPAPAWNLRDPSGVMVHSTNFAGKVVVLDFWATWCGPCKVEIPDYVYLQDKFRADGLVIVGASVDSTAQAVVTFLATNTPSLNYQVVMADAATQQAYGGIQYIPTTFIIDRQNIIRQKYVGTQTGATLEQAIRPLLYNRLGCSRGNNQLNLCWTTNAGPSTVEWTTNVANPAWSNWATLPTVVNGTNTLQIPTAGAPRYFRLRMP
jgi:thiol-disulfide isomerase/thioredoxin